MPQDLALQTCSGCLHHGQPAPAGYGECRRYPPDHTQAAAAGLVLSYGLTANDLPACGEFRPKEAAPERRAEVVRQAVHLETKAANTSSADSPRPEERPRDTADQPQRPRSPRR